MSTTRTAYCYRSGQIKIGRKVPDGAIAIISGPERRIRSLMWATSRLAYDNKTMLVPGIPEAKNDRAAETALRRFIKWITTRKARR